MKNKYLSVNSLTDISQLFQERLSKIRTLINNLKLKDVESDDEFQKTTDKIKNTILFNPVVFEEPAFVDFEYEEKQARIEQHFFNSFNKNNYIHEIKFPFKGDVELFTRSFNGMSYSGSDHGVIKPQYSDHIIVYAELPELSPDSAIIEAEKLLRLTKYIADANSASVKTWNVSIGQKIDEDLRLKREELIRIFKK